MYAIYWLMALESMTKKLIRTFRYYWWPSCIRSCTYWQSAQQMAVGNMQNIYLVMRLIARRSANASTIAFDMNANGSSHTGHLQRAREQPVVLLTPHGHRAHEEIPTKRRRVPVQRLNYSDQQCKVCCRRFHRSAIPFIQGFVCSQECLMFE